MNEWPKWLVDDYHATGFESVKYTEAEARKYAEVTGIPAKAVVPADLARELYEALKIADHKIEGEWSYRLEQVEEALARYEQEVGDG